MLQYIVNGTVFVKWYGIRQMEQYNVNGTVSGKWYGIWYIVYGKWYCMRPVLLQLVHCMPRSAQRTEQARTSDISCSHDHGTDAVRIHTSLTLRLLMSYIYGAPSKARNANVVYIWTYVWQR